MADRLIDATALVRDTGVSALTATLALQSRTPADQTMASPWLADSLIFRLEFQRAEAWDVLRDLRGIHSQVCSVAQARPLDAAPMMLRFFRVNRSRSTFFEKNLVGFPIPKPTLAAASLFATFSLHKRNFDGKGGLKAGNFMEATMNGLIYLVGLVVVILAVLSFFGLR